MLSVHTSLLTSNVSLGELQNDVPPLLLSEDSNPAGWHPINCSSCHSWLGDQSASGESRLYKFAIGSAAVRGEESAFEKYKVESVLGGAMMDACVSRECYRFVLAGPQSQIACGLVLLSTESWLATPTVDLKPVLKVLYWEDAEFVRGWAEKHGADWVVLKSFDMCLNIVRHLARMNQDLPHSARLMKDGSRLSYLFW